MSESFTAPAPVVKSRKRDHPSTSEISLFSFAVEESAASELKKQRLTDSECTGQSVPSFSQQSSMQPSTGMPSLFSKRPPVFQQPSKPILKKDAESTVKSASASFPVSNAVKLDPRSFAISVSTEEKVEDEAFDAILQRAQETNQGHLANIMTHTNAIFEEEEEKANGATKTIRQRCIAELFASIQDYSQWCLGQISESCNCARDTKMYLVNASKHVSQIMQEKKPRVLERKFE